MNKKLCIDAENACRMFWPVNAHMNWTKTIFLTLKTWFPFARASLPSMREKRRHPIGSLHYPWITRNTSRKTRWSLTWPCGSNSISIERGGFSELAGSFWDWHDPYVVLWCGMNWILNCKGPLTNYYCRLWEVLPIQRFNSIHGYGPYLRRLDRKVLLRTSPALKVCSCRFLLGFQHFSKTQIWSCLKSSLLTKYCEPTVERWSMRSPRFVGWLQREFHRPHSHFLSGGCMSVPKQHMGLYSRWQSL